MHDPPSGPRQSLDWLTTEKLLELIAHDINNLCHGALSYIDLALDPSQAPEARTRFLTTAKTLTHRASRFGPHLKLLNELRNADAMAPSEVLSRAAADAHTKAVDLNFGASLALEKSGDAWERRSVGGKFVAAALEHLFDNAIRFQRPGLPPRVWVDAAVEGAAIRITVRDNGKGFQKGAEAYAARRFSQAGSVSGAGLGLAFVRLLAERTGGSVHVGSSPAGSDPPGAVVTLRLPAAPTA